MISLTTRLTCLSIITAVFAIALLGGRPALAQSLSDALSSPLSPIAPTITLPAASTPQTVGQRDRGESHRFDRFVRRHRPHIVDQAAGAFEFREELRPASRGLALVGPNSLAAAPPIASTPDGIGVGFTPADAALTHGSTTADTTRFAGPHKLKAHKVRQLAPTQSLDSMTRDGGEPNVIQSAGQGINVGGAVLRWVVSLVLVLALAAIVIAYLRKHGYGVPADGVSRPVQSAKPMFGVSPIAQMFTQRQSTAATAAATEPAPKPKLATPFARPAYPRLDNFEVMASGSLPGSEHTLYKIRVEDRILLVSGAPGAALNLLTEWEIEAPQHDERRFNSILDQLANSDQRGVTGSGLLRSATERLERTTLRMASLGADDRFNSDGE